MTVGDVVSQIGIEKRVITSGKKYDWTSSARFLGFGLFFGVSRFVLLAKSSLAIKVS